MRAFLDAHTHTQTLCHAVSGVAIIYLAHERILVLIQQINRLRSQECRDRAGTENLESGHASLRVARQGTRSQVGVITSKEY